MGFGEVGPMVHTNCVRFRSGVVTRFWAGFVRVVLAIYLGMKDWGFKV